MSKNRLYIFASYALIYIIWSTTYLAMRLGVKSFPVFFFIGIRWFLSGIFIFVLTWMIYKKNIFKGVTKKQIRNAAMIGFFLQLVANSLTSFGVKYVDSYLAAVIGATVPLFMTLFDYFINHIKFYMRTIISIVFGIAGICLLLFDSKSGYAIDISMILLVLSVIFWSLGSAISHRLDLPKNALVSTTFQLLFAGAIGLILSLFIEKPFVGLPQISITSFFALLYLIAFGSIAMIGYVYLLKYEPLSKISTYAFINPIGATILGLFFGETLKQNFFIAMPLILIAIIIILKIRQKEPHMETEGER